MVLVTIFFSNRNHIIIRILPNGISREYFSLMTSTRDARSKYAYAVWSNYWNSHAHAWTQTHVITKIAVYSPASARCMMKKFMRFLRALLNDSATSTAPLPNTIDKNNIHRTVNCTVWKKKFTTLYQKRVKFFFANFIIETIQHHTQ